MRGDNHLLAITTTTDEVTGEVKPLFAFPIQVCKATGSEDVRFDIAAPSGAKREQIYRDPVTEKIVSDEDCSHGVIVGDEFRAIPDDALTQIKEATKITTMVALGV